MSAMRAELPELGAALPQHSPPGDSAPQAGPPQAGPSRDSARRRADVRWSAPGPVPSAATVPARPARSPAAHPWHPRAQAASTPLRLTRRGRVVAALAAVLLLAALSLVIAASAQATNHPAPRAARQNLVQVVVQPGQSLWSVAENADPDADTRVVIQQIIELNGLTGNVVFAGQRLWVPRG